MKFDLKIIYSTWNKTHNDVVFYDQHTNAVHSIQNVRSWLNASDGFVDIQGCIHNLGRVEMIEIKPSSDTDSSKEG